VVEDWSGAGFRTKQSLNAGQTAVSQVASSRHNQSCQPAHPPSTSTVGVAIWIWQTGKHVQHSAAVGWERRLSTLCCISLLKGQFEAGDRLQGVDASRLKGSGSPMEFSFPSNAKGPCRPLIDATSGGATAFGSDWQCTLRSGGALTGFSEVNGLRPQAKSIVYLCSESLTAVLHHRSRSLRHVAAGRWN